MSDRIDDLVEGMRAMRQRQAILVTALMRLGGPILVTHEDAYAAAGHDVEVEQTADGLAVRLTPARKARGR